MKKCFFCNELFSREKLFKYTELSKSGGIQTFLICRSCGKDYFDYIVDEFSKRIKEKIKTKNSLKELITGLENLDDFLVGMHQPVEEKSPCPNCDLSLEEFNISGKFGCEQCYEHFEEEFSAIALPYHGSLEHCGKIPKNYFKRKIDSDPKEKIKFLKLQLAKFVELEQYEKAAEVKKELDPLL